MFIILDRLTDESQTQEERRILNLTRLSLVRDRCDPSTQAPALRQGSGHALAGGLCSGFRLTGGAKGATGLSVGLHLHGSLHTAGGGIFRLYRYVDRSNDSGAVSPLTMA